MARRLANAGAAVLLAVPLLASGCSHVPDLTDIASLGDAPAPASFIGGVVADEPQAAAIGRDTLLAGGNAVDAAVALGFALAVTLPSRAGLGSGGACLVYAPGDYAPNKGVAEAALFVSRPPAHPVPEMVNGALVPVDRPAAVPMLPRGLFALHARYGAHNFASLIAAAEKLARDGMLAPRAFVRDLAVVAGPLAADPAARAVFFPGGRPVVEGATLVQPGLAALLGKLRQEGVGALYQGPLAHVVAEAARDAGGGLTAQDFREALPKLMPALTVAAGVDTVAFLPPPADGGLAADAAFQTLQHAPTDFATADARAQAVAAKWRQSGGDASAILAATDLPAAATPTLPASTGFAIVDRHGMAVTCALTMNNLFGTGRMAAGTGMLLAASPSWQTPPLLSAALAYDARHDTFHAAVAGSGQSGAPLAVAAAMARALAGQPAAPVPEPGRANVLQCKGYLPGSPESCAWTADPRGTGVALGATGR